MKIGCNRVILGVAVLTFVQSIAWGQPPGPPGGRPNRGGPPRFELGKVLPPFVMEELQLTREQQKQLADLEKEVKERLTKILSAEQRKQIETMQPRGPGGPGSRGVPPPGGPEIPGGPPSGGPGIRPPGGPGDGSKPAVSSGGIQWYATLEHGLAEAKRTGKPILFLSAAPHCGGVSGIW